MNHPLRIAVQILPQHGEYDDIRRAAVQAEEMGVDIVYNWDHFYPLFGDPHGFGDHRGKHFECWTMLASWAEVTERVEIGALVTCNSYRNPDLLADMARTVDHISSGRLILGIGAGWFEQDYQEYGYEFGTAGSRLADLEQALSRIEQRFAQVNPAPTRSIPILIGGGGEKKTLRYTARHANIWHGFGPPNEFARKNKILDEWCEREGTDPASIERSVAPGMEDYANLTESLDKYREAGATQFTIHSDGPDYSLKMTEVALAWREQNS